MMANRSSAYTKNYQLCFGIALFVATVNTSAYGQELKARGVVRPHAQATISSEIVAKIINMPVSTGESFKSGDVLIEFDCRRYSAQLEAIEAEITAETALLQQAVTLKKHRAGGATAVNVGLAKVGKAKADKRALEATLQQCVIKAPFDGKVVDWQANEHERPPANKPILTIVDDSKIEVEALVPSKWLRWLEAGRRFSFQVDETGKTYGMQVKQLGAVVDPVSQRIKIKANFTRETSGILPGMSGTARFVAGDG